MNSTTVVKIQAPLGGNQTDASALVYDESRSHQFTIPVTPELRRHMMGRSKAFFRARLEGDKVHLLGHLPEQGW